MEIKASQVNELRKKTGAGMMDCKKALVESNGDIEKAIEFLRKKGAAVAAKRADKSASEGLIVTKISDDKTSACMAEVNCETDFVAKGEDFTSFTKYIIDEIANGNPENVEALLQFNELNNRLTDLIGKVGEKIEVSRFVNENAENGLLIDYIHIGSKLGVLVKFENVTNGVDELNAIGKDIAMQVAAMKPICVKREEVPTDIVNKEIEIYKEIAKKEGKPEQILDRISEGKLNKFYKENCLIEQAYIKDNTKSVKTLISEFNERNESDVSIVHFHRFQLGDNKK